ncbi:CRISPR-associated protein Cas1 [Rhodothalassium salexigens DSM 2132]|uniref:CRISPR-associated endonuclease Cas1 n=1 Tax=Rhodothalassium salexigens DSM 2132 TaxID=1188247 RepID=A0A4R2PLJ7_RHOSA|nr:type I-E CRISPR-associated endonuclease Cas1e [Rhodothalassium salexigens]MBB4210859.1 CRISPR-associated protein Cas1 [Rhodothalassium salexigens DSM 2132]MBK1639148.1 subtype I-E CRISPR-associated endonuclease Cas1 [Rhodothalassium salexigens DSM 2132]TCP36483.1 CRISPR-associated protein Cas1 [Rhodothalassium salexigens DSM 2132]
MSPISGLTPPKPIPIKDRSTLVFVQKGQVDVIDGTFVVVDAEGVRTVIPVGGMTCLLLEPGTRISHAAVGLAARAGTLLLWVGEAGVRLYSAGQPGGARADRLLHQARTALDETARLKVVRRMYELRFGEPAPERRSVDQLRGIEGARVRALYKSFARDYDARWDGRVYDPDDFDSGDLANRCLSSATACLHALAEAAILAAGYAPAIGFLHTGKARAFAYDIADIFKFETVVPVAFRVTGAVQNNRPIDRRPVGDPTRAVRLLVRDAFRKTRLLEKLIPTIEDVLAAGGLTAPDAPAEAQPPAIAEPTSGDIGHRG